MLDTTTGRRLDLDNLKVDDIAIEDVASGLSKVCRFGGQTLAFHSVAQHAILVKELVLQIGRPDLALAALHHDSHEAFACDLPPSA